jgi:branched-chain amino acid transport system ATP-binding protein
VIDEIFAALLTLRATGVSLLLVEQYISRALQVADHVFVLGRGSIQFSGPATRLDAETIAELYLGGGGETPRNGALHPAPRSSL